MLDGRKHSCEANSLDVRIRTKLHAREAQRHFSFHRSAKSLGMDEPMTMVYRVKDPAMLRQVKVGDRVSFEAEEAASGYTVTKLQKSK